MRKAAHRRHGFIKSMPLEGRAAPPPWWWWLVGDLCFLCGFWLVTRQSYSSYVHFRGVTKWATQACTIPTAHMKVMKHLLCVWQWSGSHLGWVYSLNIVTSLLLAYQEVYLSVGNVRFGTIWKVALNDVGEGSLLGPIIVWSWVYEFGACGWRNQRTIAIANEVMSQL
jgi:hypothetical protein